MWATYMSNCTSYTHTSHCFAVLFHLLCNMQIIWQNYLLELQKLWIIYSSFYTYNIMLLKIALPSFVNGAICTNDMFQTAAVTYAIDVYSAHFIIISPLYNWGWGTLWVCWCFLKKKKTPLFRVSWLMVYKHFQKWQQGLGDWHNNDSKMSIHAWLLFSKQLNWGFCFPFIFVVTVIKDIQDCKMDIQIKLMNSYCYIVPINNSPSFFMFLHWKWLKID